MAVYYGRVNSAVVFIKGKADGRASPFRTGVIVSKGGLVLGPAAPKSDDAEFLLPDGRQAKGRLVGWSGEWNIALWRLDGPGPWPRVELAADPKIEPEQCVITLGFRVDNRRQPAERTPSIRLETVSGVAPEWLDTTGEGANLGWRGEVVFDLEGRLVAVGDRAYHGDGHRFYARAGAARSLWADLLAGGNVDRKRLWPAEGAGDVQAFGPGVTVPRAVRDKAVSATVRVREATRAKRPSWSGVIVSGDGVVVTCAHHLATPGTELSITLADGRTTTGRVLGVNPISDVGLMKITGPGAWPHVEMGDSRRLPPGTPYVLVGYPGELEAGQPPLVGTGVVPEAKSKSSVHELNMIRISPAIPITGGMSGGGVFDPDGRVVGVIQGGNRVDGSIGKRIELVRTNWSELSSGRFAGQAGPSALAGVEAELRRGADPVRRSIVTILDGEKPVALGTIVGRDGLVVTGASALPKAPSCRLSDGRVRPAEVVRVAREDGLALLKISVEGEPVLNVRSPAEAPSVGQVVAVPGRDEAMTLGSVSSGPRPTLPVKDDGCHHDGFRSAYEVGVAAVPELIGGPVLDAKGRMRGVAVAVVSFGFSENAAGWLIVVPSSSAVALLRD